jgi:hypothetical protein
MEIWDTERLVARLTRNPVVKGGLDMSVQQ